MYSVGNDEFRVLVVEPLLPACLLSARCGWRSDATGRTQEQRLPAALSNTLSNDDREGACLQFAFVSRVLPVIIASWSHLLRAFGLASTAMAPQSVGLRRRPSVGRAIFAHQLQPPRL